MQAELHPVADGVIASRRLVYAGLVALLAALSPALSGCEGCRSVNYAVSSPPAQSTASHRRFPQSETSLVRLDIPPGPDRPLGSRFVAAFNDSTDAVIPLASGCWRFNDDNPSLDGWATSDALGGDWTRHPQLAVTNGLRDRGVFARHGDPWLAAWSSPDDQAPGVVLYISVGQRGLDRYGPPWFLLLSRSRDGAVSFEEPVRVAGPQGAVPDGPKIAITGDGKFALATWHDVPETGSGLAWRLFWNLAAPTIGMSSIVMLDPMAVGDPPDAQCASARVSEHPRVAAGRSTFYIAGVIGYSGCTTSDARRLEVYRNSTAGLAFGAAWERIVSVPVPPNAPGFGRGMLNAQDISSVQRFGTRVDRGDVLPALAVGQEADGEFLILVHEQVQQGSAPDESSRERVVQYRVLRSESCAMQRADLVSCDGARLAPTEIDAISSPNDMDAVASRVGLWEAKPNVFTGNVPDGRVDRRVGIIWYAQPYKGLMSATAEMQARTVVEAVVSNDAGATYEGPFTLTASVEGTNPMPSDPQIGEYFHPCQIGCSNYFGEYLSGAFQFRDPGPTAIVGTWGDSREGCIDQSAATSHQHVWSGAVRPE
jgi:hypothetical protein